MTSARLGDPSFVSVIVPHYQDLAGLEICLAALDAQTFPRSRFEIVIADANFTAASLARRAAISGHDEDLLVAVGQVAGAVGAINDAVDDARRRCGAARTGWTSSCWRSCPSD